MASAVTACCRQRPTRRRRGARLRARRARRCSTCTSPTRRAPPPPPPPPPPRRSPWRSRGPPPAAAASALRKRTHATDNARHHREIVVGMRYRQSDMAAGRPLPTLASVLDRRPYVPIASAGCSQTFSAGNTVLPHGAIAARDYEQLLKACLSDCLNFRDCRNPWCAVWEPMVYADHFNW